MTKEMWDFVDAMGTGMAAAYAFRAMTGRVLGWLLVCDPPEQTAAELAEALSASKGAISGATSSLVRARQAARPVPPSSRRLGRADPGSVERAGRPASHRARTRCSRRCPRGAAGQARRAGRLLPMVGRPHNSALGPRGRPPGGLW